MFKKGISAACCRKVSLLFFEMSPLDKQHTSKAKVLVAEVKTCNKMIMHLPFNRTSVAEEEPFPCFFLWVQSDMEATKHDWKDLDTAILPREVAGHRLLQQHDNTNYTELLAAITPKIELPPTHYHPGFRILHKGTNYSLTFSEGRTCTCCAEKAERVSLLIFTMRALAPAYPPTLSLVASVLEKQKKAIQSMKFPIGTFRCFNYAITDPENLPKLEHQMGPLDPKAIAIVAEHPLLKKIHKPSIELEPTNPNTKKRGRKAAANNPQSQPTTEKIDDDFVPGAKRQK